MGKSVNTTQEDVRTSVASIYSELLEKRRIEREAKEERKQQEREAREQAKEEKKTKDDGTKMTKKEKREAEMDAWKEIVVGLTGDDLDYTETKKSKKKYRKWIDDDAEVNAVLTPKPKKVKKKNYNKEFEPELNMLKTIVADQNRFTNDLQKRFQTAAGPATKDAMPLNKTLVELASAVNASRANSLGLLREIGNIKKTIADLYMKQKKLDADLGAGSSGFNTTDLGLMGSNIASSLFGDAGPQSIMGTNEGINIPSGDGAGANPYVQQQSTYTAESPIGAIPNQSQDGYMAESFDPSSWEGPSLAANSSVAYEAIPHSIVVEWYKDENKARFKAIRDDNGEELIGCPVPTSDASKLTFNEKEMIVKGEFDETYRLEIL